MAPIPAWLSKWRVTGTWEQHRARGSAGGVDWGAPFGSPIYAPEGGGRLTFLYFSDGSSVLRITRPDGTRTELLHGHLIGSAPRDVRGGELIGSSDGRKGALGANGSNGPHIHGHDVTAGGVRVFPFSTIASTPAGGGGSGFITQGDIDMRNIRNSAGIISTVGEFSVEPVTANAWPAVQKTWGDFAQMADDEYNGQLVFAARRRADFIADIAKAIPGAQLSDEQIDALAAKFEGEFADRIGAAVAVDVSEAVSQELDERIAVLSASIGALDVQADDYQADLEQLLRSGLTGTITIAPPTP